MSAVVRATLRRARTAAAATPISTATMRSNTTVASRGEDEHERVGAGRAQDRADVVDLDHAHGGDHQHAGERGQRDRGDQARADQHDDDQRERVHDGGEPGAGAGADVDRGAGDGTGGGHAAEQRRRRCWRGPGRTARGRGRGGGRRPCRRRPWPTAGSRWRRAWRPRTPGRGTATGRRAATDGMVGCGSDDGSAPMVATSSPATAATTVATTTASSDAGSDRWILGVDDHDDDDEGHERRSRRATRRRAHRRRPCAATTAVFSPSGLATPSAAGTCCRKMITAMPRVKPSITGHGM